MNINATLLAQLIVFLVLAWVTMKFIWPPLVLAIDERSKKIADGLAEAEKGKEMLISAEIEAKNILQQARFSVQEKIAAAEQQAKILAEEILNKARNDANNVILQAENEAKNQMKLAKENLQKDIAKLAIYTAEKILSREIDESQHALMLSKLKDEL